MTSARRYYFAACILWSLDGMLAGLVTTVAFDLSRSLGVTIVIGGVLFGWSLAVSLVRQAQRPGGDIIPL